MMIDGEEYYTKADLATYFEVAPNTVNQWVSRNELKPRRQLKQSNGRTINVFHEDDVKAYAQKRYGA